MRDWIAPVSGFPALAEGDTTFKTPEIEIYICNRETCTLSQELWVFESDMRTGKRYTDTQPLCGNSMNRCSS